MTGEERSERGWPIGEDGLPDASRAWLNRLHTASEQEAVHAEVKRCLPNWKPEHFPLGWAENVYTMPLITADLDAAGLRSHRGGGIEEQDHVRTLLVMRERVAKIAYMHRKDVGQGGVTSGLCTECNWQWPCPTYDWARENSDRDPLLSPWDRSDDEEFLP